MTAYHRHAYEPIPLDKAIWSMSKHGGMWHSKGPFMYCPICKCVPDKLIGGGGSNGSLKIVYPWYWRWWRYWLWWLFKSGRDVE